MDAWPCVPTILSRRRVLRRNKYKFMKHVPPFSTLNQNGTEISNTSLLGQKYILFFYGQDDTPTCNKQVFTANEVANQAKDKGFAVFGVSPDKPAKHKKFVDKYGLKIDLLADPEKKMMYDFEAYGPKIFMGKEVTGVYRKAYLVDEKGQILKVIADVTAAQQGELILQALAVL